MPIKAIAFDLDGVLVDCKDLHYHALNAALEQVAGKKFVIGYREHLKRFDALPTKKKLEMLTEERGLKASLHAAIWEAKQNLTTQEAAKLPKDNRMLAVLDALLPDYSLYVASNSIKPTIQAILAATGIIQCFGDIVSCEEVANPKPAPDIYLELLRRHSLKPDEMLILEDSDKGLQAARSTGCPILRVKDSTEVTYHNITQRICSI